MLAALQLQHLRGNTVQWSYQGINSWTYLQSQAVGLAMYLWKMIWPHPLIMHYGFVGFPPALWVPCFVHRRALRRVRVGDDPPPAQLARGSRPS
ncbi:MAG: hypothetical protein U1F87_09190 [Kiritimatiellia bacterium]